MKYNKLVRDKIPEIITSRGAVPTTHIADGDEYRQKLRAKLEEEVAEFLQDNSAEELADILEVVYALGALIGTDKNDLEIIREKKVQTRGGFQKKIILEETRE